MISAILALSISRRSCDSICASFCFLPVPSTSHFYDCFVSVWDVLAVRRPDEVVRHRNRSEWSKWQNTGDVIPLLSISSQFPLKLITSSNPLSGRFAQNESDLHTGENLEDGHGVHFTIRPPHFPFHSSSDHRRSSRFPPVVNPAVQLLDKLAAVNADLASTTLRLSNDVRALTERHRVRNRVADQHRSAARSLDCAQAKLTEYENEVGAHSKRKDYNLKRAELGLTRLRTSKKETLLRSRDLSAQLI
jgi:hypothetical protein